MSDSTAPPDFRRPLARALGRYRHGKSMRHWGSNLMRPFRPAGEIRLVHSSDIHVDERRIATAHEGNGTGGLAAVLATARALRADIVLLAGDTFEANQLSARVIDRAGGLLADAGMPVVILPGNHDPASPDSIYVKGGYAHIPDIAILGVTHDEAAVFAEFDVEIWGHAHRDYFDMPPLRGPRPRSTRWQVAIAHGHYEPPATRANPLRPSWVFSDEEIVATAADYLALGHWDRPMRVSEGAVPAYYSGSPELARTVNLARLTATGEVVVTREPIRHGVSRDRAPPTAVRFREGD
jgi:DNA repair exonuclease SbcCD nuclease subunit